KYAQTNIARQSPQSSSIAREYSLHPGPHSLYLGVALCFCLLVQRRAIHVRRRLIFRTYLLGSLHHLLLQSFDFACPIFAQNLIVLEVFAELELI
ncbi:MAG: hypothetical protein Q9218_008402, partial [Villophora microphyllina]